MKLLLEALRDARRQLAGAPGVALVAIATLGVGIGASTAIFSVVNAVLLRPLPFAQPEQLVRVIGTDASRHYQNLSPLDVDDFRAQGTTLEVAGLSIGSTLLAGVGEPCEVTSVRGTGNLFELLRTTPRLGRLFHPDEEIRGRHHVAVLSHAGWLARFGGDPSVLGRTATLDGVACTIVGVLPAEFRNPAWDSRGEPEVYTPLPRAEDPGARGGHWLVGIARLRPETTLRAAQQEMDGITTRLATLYPDTNTDRHTRLVPLASATVAEVRPALVLLLQAVGLLLVIACANVAGLLLAKAAGREREIAIRRALGAGTGRIVRQLLAESAALGLLGGVLGVLLAYWGTDVIIGLAAETLPRAAGVAVDTRVLVFAIAVSLLTGVLSGLAPALRLARPDLSVAIHAGSSMRTAGGRSQRARRVLVVAETALAVVLLATAGLFAKSMWRLGQVEPGFSGDHVLTFEVAVPAALHPDETEAGQLHARILERIGALPGVRSAGAVNILPLGGDYSCDGFSIPEHPPVPVAQEPCAEARIASPGYFSAMGIPLRRGRALDATDGAHDAPVVVIDEAFAARFFAGEDPLGKHVVYNAAAREIVGVVGSVKHFALTDEAPPEFYLPLAQQPMRSLALALRTDADPSSFAGAVRNAVAEIDASLAVAKVRTTGDLLSRSIARPRFRTLLLGAFAVIAVVLALIGIYGLVAYFVSRRTREIAVRAALGATGADVVRLFVADGLRLCAVGVVLGLGLAAAASRALAGLLFEVAPLDASVLTAVALGLIATSALACYLPARRAARVAPATALRAE